MNGILLVTVRAMVRVAHPLLWPAMRVWAFVHKHDWEVTALALGLLNTTMLALADPTNGYFQAYAPAASIMPLTWWAALFGAAAALLWISVPLYNMPMVRLGLFATAALWGFFGWGFIFAEVTPWAGVANRFAVSIIAGVTYLLASRGDDDARDTC